MNNKIQNKLINLNLNNLTLNKIYPNNNNPSQSNIRKQISKQLLTNLMKLQYQEVNSSNNFQRNL